MTNHRMTDPPIRILTAEAWYRLPAIVARESGQLCEGSARTGCGRTGEREDGHPRRDPVGQETASSDDRGPLLGPTGGRASLIAASGCWERRRDPRPLQLGEAGR